MDRSEISKAGLAKQICETESETESVPISAEVLDLSQHGSVRQAQSKLLIQDHSEVR